MSSIRLFILGSLAERGEMHGHQLRLLAEEEHIDMWTDFTVGAVYGAIKRLAVEGLISVVRTEREGNYPERHVYGITDAGRESLETIRDETLHAYELRADPFDLALARLDEASLEKISDILARRRKSIIRVLDDRASGYERAEPHLTLIEKHTMRHQRFRLEAELSWLDSVIADLPNIIHDEKSRKAL